MTDEQQQDQPVEGGEGAAADSADAQTASRPSQPLLSRKQFTVSKRIADRLGEEKRGPRTQIMKVIAARGVNFAWRKMEDAVRIEKAGGMMTKAGNRRRTPGGIFFHLVRQELNPTELRQIFPPMQWRKKPRDPNAPPPPPPPPRLPDFAYGSRSEIVGGFETEGQLNTFKVVMVGRPLSLKQDERYIVAEMVYQARAPFFPRGVPYDIPFDTQYPVYMATKQWERVAEALDSDPEDKLIIEGTAGWSQELDRLAVYATNVTTRALERARYQK